jgi:hypothetical protein
VFSSYNQQLFPNMTIKRLVLISLLAVAAQANVQAQNFSPIPLTPGSFTQEVVIPVDWTYKLNAQSVTVTIDHGPSLQTNTVAGFPIYYSVQSGDTFFEAGMDRTNTAWGFPPGGSMLTNVTLINHIYQLPYWTNYNSNCIALGPFTNGGTYNSQPLTGGPYIGQSYYTNINLTLNNNNDYTALSLLCSGGGPDVENVIVSYADGTTQSINFTVPNWFVNANYYTNTSTNAPSTPPASFAFTANARFNPAENQNTFASTAVTSGSRLWSVDLALSDTASYATNLSFSVITAGAHATAIFAVSGSINPADDAIIPNTNVLSGPFSPISVSGFNAGCVVANSPHTLAGLAPLTATMDNGTNILAGANTWFEKGWDQAAPANGFPVHGSILTSVSNPARTYQMPSSYHQPMCSLIDANHKTVNITPQTPASYVAFSLLTCGASIGNGKVMTNYIILQHSDGVNESNLFYGYDWFETTVPPAYVANERVTIGANTTKIDREVANLDGGNPKLFDSEFQLQDGTPVTNMIVGYLTAPAAAAATYVIAVSATTNLIPVQFAAGTTAQNVYAGQNAVFQANLAFGTFPTYQWQFTDGATFTNNLVNGPTGTGSTISGANSLTLTVSGVSSADLGYYTCQAENSFPSTTNSAIIPLTLLVSTASDIAQPGDPITDFGEAIPSPAGLTLPDVIDSTMATYLNYGESGNTAGPFYGPVGIIVTPNLGSSIVTALRFVNAVNAPTCDPADYMLEGSNDGGNTWTIVVNDTPLNLPVTRNVLNSGPINITNFALQEVDFPNTASYSSYRLTINSVRTPASANSMQIAEIQFLGVLGSVAPGILVQPAPMITLFVGGTLTMSVTPNGPAPITYQWYYNGTTAISGATNANYTLSNVQLASAGNYSCTVSNPYGSTVSSNLVLTVLPVPSSAYAQQIIADHPVAYFRLDEGPDDGNGDNGVVANDYVGGHAGLYTNVVLGVPGYDFAMDTNTAVSFGTTLLTNVSCVGNIKGITFATPTNQNGEFSVEVWVQNPAGQEIINSAGIIASGLGGGGEQFALDCDGSAAPQNGFRFYFRDAVNNTAHNATCTNNTGDGLWHHIVGVCDEANSNELLYVDGQLVGKTILAANLGVSLTNPMVPLLIGARTSADTNGAYPGLQFIGTIDEVALYNYALSFSQVQNHYFLADIAPKFTSTPTNQTVTQGATASFSGSAFGSPTLSYQWYVSEGGIATTPLSGQTSTNLVFSNVQSDLNGTYYQLVVSNAYGSVTSSAVLLTVLSGSPIIETDLQPQYFVYSGFPLVLSVTAGGTPPFTYQWQYNSVNLTDGGRVSGSQTSTLTIANTQTNDSGTYQLLISNGQGTTPTTAAMVTILPTLSFNGLGSGWSMNGGVTYPSNNVLLVTDGGGEEARSSFFSYPVYVGGFRSSFTYQDIGGGGADGAAFVVQNDPRGAAALGGAGGALGYTGITPSAAVEFNIYANNTPGYAFEVNGTVPNPFTAPGLVQVGSGNPISVNLLYLNGVLSLMMQDTVTGASYSTSANVNIPAVVGTNDAYVGITGSDGGTFSTQQVSNFSFISLIDLQASVSGSNIIVTWPAAVGGYTLQQSSSLTSPNWTPVPLSEVTTMGGLNQATIPAGSGSLFFQLVLPP